MSFAAGILARARRHLGRLRLTFGLGPSGGAPPDPQPAPILCLTAVHSQPLELFATAGPALFLEATSRPELLLEPGLLSGAAVPALLLEAWVEAC